MSGSSTERYRCARCEHVVIEGSDEYRVLRWTSSPDVLFGICASCVERKREAARAKVKPLPKDTPVAFRRVAS